MRQISLAFFSALGLLMATPSEALAEVAASSAPVFRQRLGVTVPQDLILHDESGQAVRLGSFLGQRPVILVPGYFRCPNLCSTVLDGVMTAIARAGADADLVAFSIDPREGPREAREKLAGYGRLLPAQRLHFLTGTAVETGRLAAAIGFSSVWDAERDQYLHPAGFLLLTPTGRIAHYVIGAATDSRSLDDALNRARAGRIDGITSGFALGCTSNDSLIGRYGGAVLTALRLLAVASIAGLAWWLRSRQLSFRRSPPKGARNP